MNCVTVLYRCETVVRANDAFYRPVPEVMELMDQACHSTKAGRLSKQRSRLKPQTSRASMPPAACVPLAAGSASTPLSLDLAKFKKLLHLKLRRIARKGPQRGAAPPATAASSSGTGGGSAASGGSKELEIKHTCLRRFHTLCIAFKALDSSDDGSISKNELKAALEMFGRPPPATEEEEAAFDVLFAQLDADGSDELGYAEFVLFLATQLSAEGSQRLVDERLRRFEVLHGVFTAIDKDGSGGLSFKELRPAFELFGFQLLGPEGLKAKFDAVDEDHSGSIEFAEVCTTVTLTRPKECSGASRAGSLVEAAADPLCVFYAPCRVHVLAQFACMANMFIMQSTGEANGPVLAASAFSSFEMHELKFMQLSEVFDKFADSSTHEMMVEGLTRAMVKLGLRALPEDVAFVFTQLDEDKSGRVDFAEFATGFVRAIALLPAQQLTPSTLVLHMDTPHAPIVGSAAPACFQASHTILGLRVHVAGRYAR